MAIAVRRVLVALALLASSVASASIDGAFQPVVHVSLLSAPHERLTLSDEALRTSFPRLRPPMQLPTSAPKVGARAGGRPPAPPLVLDPRFYRWEIDELGGAWFSPTVSGGVFVGRLLFLF